MEQLKDEFRIRLERFWPELSPPQQAQVLRFYELVLIENERQNLTRLTSPQDFLEGHVWDVKELLASGFLENPAMDLGSGVGVPGLLAGILGQGEWVLAESEGRKAEFLKAAAADLGLARVRVFSGRGEEFLKTGRISSIVARAVGPVERIYTWLEHCSTWNTLVLFKGPRWVEEWAEFQRSRHRGRLELLQERVYSAGEEKKERRILKLRNVPRGTTGRKQK